MKHARKDESLFVILKDLVVSYCERVAHLTQLAALETKLAVRTLISMIVLFYFFSICLTSAWLCILLVSFTYLLSLHYSAVSAALLVALLNAVILIALGVILVRIKDNLFFPSTRSQLKNIYITDKRE